MATILKNIFKFFIIGILGIVIANSCKKFDYGTSINAVKTIGYNNVLQITATVSAKILTDNGSKIISRGICFSTSKNPTIDNSKKADLAAGLGDYSCILINLLPSTTYYTKAYATNAFGTAYGNELSFTTQAATVPIISETTAANTVSATSAKSGGVITNNGASEVLSRGICYSTSVTSPTISQSKTNDGIGIGTFISSLTSLTPNTIYYIRAYATNSIGTGYGDVKSFSTSQITVPSGIISSLASFNQISANAGGTIASDGGGAITARGVCWSSGTTTTPTIANSKTIDGAGIGNFSSLLIGLLPGTIYYLRAYGTNSAGTAYGNIISFTTSPIIIPVGVSTSSVSAITQTSASSGGIIASDGGATVTSRGVCWSNTNSAPTILNSKTLDGTGIGGYTSAITGLIAGTTYYVRAYATNSAGSSYGNLLIFTTASATIPVGVTTASITSISQTAAVSGGSVTSDGGASITARGVCWSSITASPTIINSPSSNDGTGTGLFISSLTALTANTTYYVRAYATNIAGTSYGAFITFTSLPPPLAGQNYQGGIIAYILKNGDAGYIAGETHGIIAATSDQSTGAAWGCSGVSVSTNTSLGAGKNNTALIIKNCTSSNIAALICDNLSLSGFTDWFLPSSDELYKLYLNKGLIGGFSGAYYLSSSQYTVSTALNYNFNTGGLFTISKSTIGYVRAIRQF